MKQATAGCDGRHFRCVDGSFLINQNCLLATAATWGSEQEQREGGQGVAGKVYALWKVLKQIISIDAVG